jgi:energy-coupling factor transporter ATP-binding protein EcfA2
MAEQPHMTSIRFSGVHGHQLLQADFKPGLNILHGKNGTGKTTLLHILANVFEGDLLRFCSIRFEHLTFRLSDGTEIQLQQNREADRAAVRVSVRGNDFGELSRGAPVPDSITTAFKELFPKRPVYLPAFRSILEAASSREDYRGYQDSPDLRNQIAQIEAHERRNAQRPPERYYGSFGPFASTAAKTVLSRHWFGDFVPIVRYPSLADVSAQLTNEAQRAYINVNQSNQATFSTVFNDVLNAVQKGLHPQGVEDVGELFGRVQNRLLAISPVQQNAPDAVQPQIPWREQDEKSFRTVLEIYDKALATREANENKAYSRLRVFEASINKFISPKKLIASQPGDSARRGPRVLLSKNQSEKLDVLSSGERQVLTMLFCATHMSEADGVMLIDEPEISLHVDWQRIVLDEIIKQAGDRQIVACTHAPEVVAEHSDSLILLNSTQQEAAPRDAASDDEAIEGD